mgnify:CR=1 FL=1
MSTPEMGKMWIETVYLQTGIKADVKNFSGPHAAYFTELMDRQKGEKYFIGQPRDMVTGECKDAFAQVMNSGFPGGLLSVDQTVQMMNKACYRVSRGSHRGDPNRADGAGSTAPPAADRSNENPRPPVAPRRTGSGCPPTIDARRARLGILVAFLAPALLVYAGFTIYPVVRTFYNAFFTHQPQGVVEFVGFGNFTALLFADPTFWKAVTQYRIVHRSSPRSWTWSADCCSRSACSRVHRSRRCCASCGSRPC